MQGSESLSEDMSRNGLIRLYALRLWREHAGAPWRAALRPADGGDVLGFADLEQLAMYLLGLADRRTPPEEEAGHGAA
jgi:hypothetical protein